MVSEQDPDPRNVVEREEGRNPDEIEQIEEVRVEDEDGESKEVSVEKGMTAGETKGAEEESKQRLV